MRSQIARGRAAATPLRLLLATLLIAVAWAASAGTASAVGASVATKAEQAPGTVGFRLTEAPAAAADDPRSMFYIVDDVAAGDTFTRSMELTNTSGETQDIEVYAGPASVEDGAWAVGEPGDQNELSSWVSVSRQRVTVPAGGSAPVRVTVAVPDDATAGERYGVIWAATSSERSDGVTMVNRVGVRIYLAVSGSAPLATDFTIASLIPSRDEEGFPVVTARIVNIGQRAIDLQGALRLRNGPGGIKAGPFAMPGGVTVGVDEAVDVPIRAPADLPDGPWDVKVFATSGLVQRTAYASLTFPASADAGPGVPTSPTIAGGPDALPDTGAGAMLPGLLGLAVIAGAIPLLLVWRRRREHELTAAATTSTSSASMAAVADEDWLAGLDRWRGST